MGADRLLHSFGEVAQQVPGVCGLVSPSICSADVTAGRCGLRHLNQRTMSSTTTGAPPTGASASRRAYRPWTRHGTTPHLGHLAVGTAE